MPQIRSLTSLRFFAAAIVVCEHYFGFRFGHLGVSFFYVLSGFVLTYIYDGKLSKPGAKSGYFVRRFARIYPAHFAVYLYSLPYFLYAAWLHGSGMGWIIVGLISNLFLLHSWIPDQGIYFGFGAGSWSLSDEMFFYATFPFLIRLRHLPLVTVCLALVIIAAVALHPAPELGHWLFYINPGFRLLEFLVGILCCRWFLKAKSPTWPATPLELAAIASLGCAVAICYFIPPPISYSLIFIGPSAFIIWTFAHERGLISRALTGPVLVELGEASYALYLLHAITFLYVSHLVGKSVLIEGVLAIVVVGASVLMHTVYERPLRRWIIARFSASRAKPEGRRHRRVASSER